MDNCHAKQHHKIEKKKNKQTTKYQLGSGMSLKKLKYPNGC
jgi:hypothetical protein